MMILGISAFYHDSAAAIIQDGEVIAAAQEERFSRKKHDPSFPLNAIRFCLQYAACNLNDLDAIVFYDKPFLKFERILETYYAFAPKGVRSFLRSMPLWMKEKLFLKKIICDELKRIDAAFDRQKVKLLFPEHHLSHAASAFYPSSFKESAIITIDGVGEWATASVGYGKDHQITIVKELHFPHSLGLLYSAFTYYCGFKVNSGEYKLMGLAPYGNKESEQCYKFMDIIKNRLVDIRKDGSVFINQQYFKYATGLRMVHHERWRQLFGFPRRAEESPLEQPYCDLALAIQLVTEEVVLKMAATAKRITGSENVCLAGGVALNCVANGKLHAAGIFSNIFIQPAAGDAGGALGAALAAYHIYFNQPRKINAALPDGLKGTYLGPEYSEKEIEMVAKKYKAPYRKFDDSHELIHYTAALLAQGKVVGWFQGRMEFGPRALGARSILADARDVEMQKKLNLLIKFREGFRPFAPAVPAEQVHEYFELEEPSPYMLLTKPVKQGRRQALPADYNNWPLAAKLNFIRSDIPAVTHIDYSARIQTVHKETNFLFWQLLQAFKAQTGYAVLVNTSFNVRGEPVVNTPEDAYRCFMHTGIDFLVMNNFVFDKSDQLPLQESAGVTTYFSD